MRDFVCNLLDTGISIFIIFMSQKIKTFSKQIAIIEDDDSLRRGLKTVFLRQGFSVTTFDDGAGVFESFSDRVPDVILCDYKLPSTDGIKILKEIRKTYMVTPFFLMTGYYREDLELEANKEGANAVFEKPLNMEMLVETCRGGIV